MENLNNQIDDLSSLIGGLRNKQSNDILRKSSRHRTNHRKVKVSKSKEQVESPSNQSSEECNVIADSLEDDGLLNKAKELCRLAQDMPNDSSAHTEHHMDAASISKNVEGTGNQVVLENSTEHDINTMENQPREAPTAISPIADDYAGGSDLLERAKLLCSAANQLPDFSTLFKKKDNVITDDNIQCDTTYPTSANPSKPVDFSSVSKKHKKHKRSSKVSGQRKKIPPVSNEPIREKISNWTLLGGCDVIVVNGSKCISFDSNFEEKIVESNSIRIQDKEYIIDESIACDVAGTSTTIFLTQEYEGVSSHIANVFIKQQSSKKLQKKFTPRSETEDLPARSKIEASIRQEERRKKQEQKQEVDSIRKDIKAQQLKYAQERALARVALKKEKQRELKKQEQNHRAQELEKKLKNEKNEIERIEEQRKKAEARVRRNRKCKDLTSKEEIFKDEEKEEYRRLKNQAFNDLTKKRISKRLKFQKEAERMENAKGSSLQSIPQDNGVEIEKQKLKERLLRNQTKARIKRNKRLKEELEKGDILERENLLLKYKLDKQELEKVSKGYRSYKTGKLSLATLKRTKQHSKNQEDADNCSDLEEDSTNVIFQEEPQLIDTPYAVVEDRKASEVILADSNCSEVKIPTYESVNVETSNNGANLEVNSSLKENETECPGHDQPGPEVDVCLYEAEKVPIWKREPIPLASTSDFIRKASAQTFSMPLINNPKRSYCDKFKSKKCTSSFDTDVIRDIAKATRDRAREFDEEFRRDQS